MNEKTLFSKKLIALFLILILTIGTMPPLNLMGAQVPILMKDGVITFTFEDNLATTSTRYRTIGWMIHTEPSENRAPLTLGSDKVIKIMDFTEVDSKVDGNRITTTFEISERELTAAIKGTALENCRNGQTIYLSSIFAVVKGQYPNESIGAQKYTYNAISTAEGWSSQAKSDMKAYYNIKLKFDMPPQQVDKVIRVNGSGYSRVSLGEKEVGSPATVTFDEYMTIKGVKYKLQSSWGEYNGKQVHVQNGSTLTRSMTVPVGGLDIVANYVPDPEGCGNACTPAPPPAEIEPDPEPDEGGELTPVDPPSGGVYRVLQTTDGIIFKVDKEYSTQPSGGGTEYYVKLPESQVLDDGKTYTLVKSYMMNADSGYKMHEKTVKNDGLYTTQTRNFTSAWKETHLVGEYEAEPTKPPSGGTNQNGQIAAHLILEASDDYISFPGPETVSFTLDAGYSQSSGTIEEYTYWISTNKSDLENSRDYFNSSRRDFATTSLTISESTMVYAKVEITDSNNKTATAYAQVFIQMEDPVILGDPTVQLTIDPFRFLPTETGTFKPVIQSGGSRYSTTSRYWKIFNGDTENIVMEGTGEIGSIAMSKLNVGKYTAVQYIEWTDVFGKKFSANDAAPFEILVMGPPDVDLMTTKDEYHVREDVEYVLKYFEDPKFTYPITKKEWAIYDLKDNIVSSGTGDIPKTYKYHLHSHTGSYYATQTIYYNDPTKGGAEDYTMGYAFYFIKGLEEPGVSINTNQDLYYTPWQMHTTTVFVEDAYYKFPIHKKTWQLVNRANNSIVATGSGIFPAVYNLAVEFPQGDYQLKEIITYLRTNLDTGKDLGVVDEISIAATKNIKVINPIPEAVFDVSMRVTRDNQWEDVIWNVNQGKQYKQIRVDISKSFERNVTLNYPWAIDFGSENTQIKVIPLNDDMSVDLTRNANVVTYTGSDKTIIEDNVTFKGPKLKNFDTTLKNRYIDIRFDKPGRYRIKARVVNQYYVGEWTVKDIYIREDLPPNVTFSFPGLSKDSTTGYAMAQRVEDLSATFNVSVSATSQDDDTPDYENAVLEMKYDYNGDNNPLNDALHSSMSIKKSSNNVLHYVSVLEKNQWMTGFKFKLYDNTVNAAGQMQNPTLGKVQFEYVIGKIPTIPYYEGGDMPKVNYPKATTYNYPDSEKTVFIDNTAPQVSVSVGKEGKVDVYIYFPSYTAVEGMSIDKLGFNINEVITYFGDNMRLYVEDKTGNIIPWN